MVLIYFWSHKSSKWCNFWSHKSRKWLTDPLLYSQWRILFYLWLGYIFRVLFQHLISLPHIVSFWASFLFILFILARILGKMSGLETEKMSQLQTYRPTKWKSSGLGNKLTDCFWPEKSQGERYFIDVIKVHKDTPHTQGESKEGLALLLVRQNFAPIDCTYLTVSIIMTQYTNLVNTPSLAVLKL